MPWVHMTRAPHLHAEPLAVDDDGKVGPSILPSARRSQRVGRRRRRGGIGPVRLSTSRAALAERDKCGRGRGRRGGPGGARANAECV